MNFLHNLQGQFFGSHFFISSLNFNKEFISRISKGTNSQIFGPSDERLSDPWFTDLILGCVK